MNELFKRLLQLMQELEPTARTPPDALHAVLRSVAAFYIQADAAAATPPAGSWPDAILEAVVDAAQRAAALNAVGTRLQVVIEDLPLAAATGGTQDAPSAILGPFVTNTGRLLRFCEFEAPALLPVVVSPALVPDETVLLIPADARVDPNDAQTLLLPAGSVWILSKLLAAGTPDYSGLRIRSGTLRVTGALIAQPDRILLPDQAPWTLVLEPAQPSAATPTGSDAASIDLTLPTQLVVHASAASDLSGAVTLAGFGSSLSAQPAQAAPFVSNRLMLFPLELAAPDWTIDQNRSQAAQLSGKARVDAAFWALPQSSLSPGDVARAPHGGSLVLQLTAELDSQFAGLAAPAFRWFVATLTANASRIELDGHQVAAGGGGDVWLWSEGQCNFGFAGQPIARLLFRSERSGDDAVAIVGGLQQNLWDRPVRSDGAAFAFAGAIDLFGLLCSDRGFLLTSRAHSQAQDQRAGLALENLYLIVRPPHRCMLVAAFNPAQHIAPAGSAWSFFACESALPMLPDPYAANGSMDQREVGPDDALRVRVTWSETEPPTTALTLQRSVPFPNAAQPPALDQDEQQLYGKFRGFIDAQRDRLYLLDLSSREHQFGVAFDVSDDGGQAVIDNRFALPLSSVRLLMLPQVHWEPAWVEPPPPNPSPRVLPSLDNGGPTLIGAHGDDLVPVLPTPVCDGVLDVIRKQRRAAALFSLPFGLRAMARLSPDEQNQGVDTSLHEPELPPLVAARQVRLHARGQAEDPSRTMPGTLLQRKNLSIGPAATSVLPDFVADLINTRFLDAIPLHQADLSGYGLSAFSEWRTGSQADLGITKVHFQVLNGRTAYEVIQVRTVLFESGPRVVRTLTLERRNSGNVIRSDSGWDAIEDGVFDKPLKFQTGVVRAFRNIRRIRIIGEPFPIPSGAALQPVIFDADLEIEGLEGGGANGMVPMRDRPGYVQVRSSAPGPDFKLLSAAELASLFERVGPIASPVDCGIRIADTLGMDVSSISSDVALDDANGFGFAVAALGNPRLPRGAEWNAVRIDPGSGEAMPVDPRRGVPVVRNGGMPYVLRDAKDARRTQAKTRYGLMMATASSRTLFPQPRIDPLQPRRIFGDPPLLADPYALVQSARAFPRTTFALQLLEAPELEIASDHVWKLLTPTFTFTSPVPDLLKGGEWALSRSFTNPDPIQLVLDAAAAKPWQVKVPATTLELELPGLGKIFQLQTLFEADSGGLPKLSKPRLDFIGALADIKELIDTLKNLFDLGFDCDVDVAAGSGASPAFTVRIQLVFRLGKPNERVDIGVGKFFGQFLLQGTFAVGASGVDQPRLFLEFQGDIQQGIIPPLLYAGGLFRFGITIPETGRPEVQLTLGVVASIGGDLIPGLIAVEVTVKYGYSLIPETLQPGVLLGLDARAKLLGGLVGFSFGVEAMARIQRAGLEGVRIWAKIRVAATVQVAILFEEDVDFETQFEQLLPLELATLIPGVGLAGLAPALTRV